MHPKITVGAMLVAVVSSIVALANAVTSLSGPIHVLATHHAEKIIAAASIVSGIGAVVAGFGRPPR